MTQIIKTGKKAVHEKLSGMGIIATLFWLLASSSSLSAATSAQDRHNPFFQVFTEHFFGRDFDWRLFKSQGYVESRLREHVKSSRGATGVMQLMPTTYREIQKKNNYFSDKKLNDPETNIAAGIFYNHYLYNRWLKQELSAEMRMNLMLASYNAGYSRTIKAWNKAGKPRQDWKTVIKYLPTETRNYVRRILTHYTEQLQKDGHHQIVRYGENCPVAANFERSFC